MSYLGIAAFNKERTKLFCIAHNLSTERFNVVWEELKRKGAPVIHFIHAMDHTGPPPECAACIAAIEEGMKMAAEEDDRERRRSASSGATGQSTGPSQILGSPLSHPESGGKASTVPGSTETGQTT